MKKILLVFAACALFMACGGDEKKELTVEEKATAYAQQYFEAAAAEFSAYLGEEVEIPVSTKDVLNEFATWLKSLDNEQKTNAYEAVEAAGKEYAAEHDGVSYDFPDYNELVYYL